MNAFFPLRKIYWSYNVISKMSQFLIKFYEFKLKVFQNITLIFFKFQAQILIFLT